MDIHGLNSLYSLRSLNLAFNSIKSLFGFESLHGYSYSIEFLDIKGNPVSDRMKELIPLYGCQVVVVYFCNLLRIDINCYYNIKN